MIHHGFTYLLVHELEGLLLLLFVLHFVAVDFAHDPDATVVVEGRSVVVGAPQAILVEIAPTQMVLRMDSGAEEVLVAELFLSLSCLNSIKGLQKCYHQRTCIKK